VTKKHIKKTISRSVSFDIYRHEDHDGNEITVSNLVDRYLSNPELCFDVGRVEMELQENV
jgi:hypothetical protein